MDNTIKTHVLLFLNIISTSFSWHGINASAALSELQSEEPVQVSYLVESEEVNGTVPPPDVYSESTYRDAGLSQHPQAGPVNGRRWPLEQIHALRLIPLAEGNSPILVAILDTGIDRYHNNLRGRVVADVNFTDSPTSDDIYGHGTAVAGIITSDDFNSSGVIGLSPASLLANVKIADDSGRCQTAAVADAIMWSVDNGARVINISIELREPSSGLSEAVDYAWSRGAIVIAAAGNDGSNMPVYPASFNNCIGVTATQEDGTLAPLANYGDWVDVAAPGSDIYSTLPSNGYGYKHGTSFAAAYVSGLAALLFPLVTDTSGNGRLNDEVCQAIYNGCRELGIDGTGEGIIDVAMSMSGVMPDS